MPGHILRCHGVFVTHAVNGLVYTESWVIRVVVAIDFDASIVVVVVRMGFHFVAFVVDLVADEMEFHLLLFRIFSRLYY